MALSSLFLTSKLQKTSRKRRVWVGVVGRMAPAQVIEKLTRNRGLIQKAVSKRVVLRNTPKLTFKHDNSAQRGVSMVNLLDDIENNAS